MPGCFSASTENEMQTFQPWTKQHVIPHSCQLLLSAPSSAELADWTKEID